ncbi:hypothetical protein GUITHDRAFT_133246 [Guillardia theta CCMP2712]|uniref:Amidohydrolase-related domain-containing protein n=1 Tax=Guillardia theta (strain CCMP2712) TaxID=905079 RepID=L1JW80_GUITC|nr:hypothetical protein GUITHDRAFT_133246 [Guillardia theta CCMP2712]EKX52816.1 hypothetical protein GUITHDRAFT_133246 [Guillardia theta CCMP2712]|eukprot:XP_005839796.1 hypothetical protein GUITHDRAFT_133246 [Guillardia theta CCMP2712]
MEGVRSNTALLLLLACLPLTCSFAPPSSLGIRKGKLFKHEVSRRKNLALSCSSVAQDHDSVIASERAYITGVFQPALLSIKNGRIESINKTSCLEIERLRKAGASEGTLVLQPNQLLLPAMVNGHTHLAMGAFRGITDAESFKGNVVEDLFFKLEGALTEDDVRAFTRMGCWESMLAGVGAAWEHYYFGEALASAFADTGFSGVIAPTIQASVKERTSMQLTVLKDLSGPGTVLKGCDWEAAIETTIRMHRDESLQRKGIFAALGPHATDTISPSLWRKIASTAQQEQLPMHSHVAQSIEPLVLQEYRRCIDRHGMFVSSRDLAFLDPGRHMLGLCPASAVQFGFPCNFQAWDAAGFKIALGTDAACSNDGMNVQQEMRLLAGGGVFGVMSSPEMQKFEKREGGEESCPAGASAALRWELDEQMHPHVKMGELREGSLGNLLIVDGDHPNLWPSTAPLRTVCYANLSPCIQGLMVAGRWIGEVGNFQESILSSSTFKEQRKEAEERLDCLLRSLNLV